MNITMEAIKLINIITHLFETIFTWKKIFTQITLSVILPLVVTFAGHTFIPNIQKTPHDMFKLTFTHSFYDPTFAITIFFYHSITYLTEYDTTLSEVKFMKLALNHFLRLIATFMFVYFLNFFGYNLMVAVLCLMDTIVVTLFVVWCVIITVYLLGLSYLLFVRQLFVMIKLRGLVEVETALEAISWKVVNGFLVNLMVMSPLIRNVGERLAPMWEVMISGMALVLFLPMVLMVYVDLLKRVILGMKVFRS
ncbi:hypothetical protein HanIR_Chr05g0252441 [Helianthus annuus]|nr:hypothetical protein HanIR_Chr05g0252441 [Helianthus annuus]